MLLNMDICTDFNSDDNLSQDSATQNGLTR